MGDSNIKTANSVAKILFWMLIFLLLNIPIFAIIIAALAGCVWGIIWAIQMMILGGDVSNGVGNIGNVFGGLFLVAVFLALIILVLKLTFSTFRSLRNKEKEQRIEITESDAPELVQFINNLAELTKNKHPKHIYVSAEANASVFFNSRFINIFLPVRKNIEIGLSLFNGLTKGELAACICHEFGHFSQANMRWGTIVYILNPWIKSVMRINNVWNSIVNTMINFPWIIGGAVVLSIGVKAIGWILYGLSIGYTKVMEFIYQKIQMSYLELSRKMEYEADMISAKTVGSKYVISFMYKLLELSNRVDVYQRMLLRLADRNIKITDYWQFYLITNNYLTELTNKELSSTKITSTPLTPISDRKLIVENIYSTHPDWQKRINAIKKTNYASLTNLTGQADSLVPKELWNKISKLFLENLYNNLQSTNQMVEIRNSELTDCVKDELYWYQYMPFFQRSIIEFDTQNCKPDINAFSLDDIKALSDIKAFEAAKSDLLNAKAIVNNQLKIKQVIYNGEKYNKDNLPIETIQDEYNKTLICAKKVDQTICQKALAGEKEEKYIRAAYGYIFYAQFFLDEFNEKVTPILNKVIDILNKSNSNNNSHQFKKIQDALDQLRNDLYDCAYDKMNLDIFNGFAPQNAINCLNEFGRNQGMFIGNSISANAINLVISTCQWIKEVHETIIDRSKMLIIDACLAKEQHDSNALSEDENALDNDMVPCPSSGEMLKIGDSVYHKYNTSIVLDDDSEESVHEDSNEPLLEQSYQETNEEPRNDSKEIVC